MKKTATALQVIKGNKRPGQLRGNETREKLYEAALQAFRQQGFADTQIEAITRAAGKSRANFYFHFPNGKDDILAEAQRRRAQRIYDTLLQRGFAETQPASIKQFLEITLDVILQQAVAEEDPRLLPELLALQIRRPSQEGNSNPLVKLVYDFFYQASQQHQVRDDISPTELTRAFMNCTFDLLREVAEQPANYQEHCHNIIRIFVRGVSP